MGAVVCSSRRVFPAAPARSTQAAISRAPTPRPCACGGDGQHAHARLLGAVEPGKGPRTGDVGDAALKPILVVHGHQDVDHGGPPGDVGELGDVLAIEVRP